jgi:hypothetical protein
MVVSQMHVRLPTALNERQRDGVASMPERRQNLLLYTCLDALTPRHADVDCRHHAPTGVLQGNGNRTQVGFKFLQIECKTLRSDQRNFGAQRIGPAARLLG